MSGQVLNLFLLSSYKNKTLFFLLMAFSAFVHAQMKCDDVLNKTPNLSAPNSEFPKNFALDTSLPFSNTPRVLPLTPSQILMTRNLATLIPGGLSVIEGELKENARIFPEETIDLWIFLTTLHLQKKIPSQNWTKILNQIKDVLTFKKETLGFAKQELTQHYSENAIIFFAKAVADGLSLSELQESAALFKSHFNKEDSSTFLNFWVLGHEYKEKNPQTDIDDILFVQSKLSIQKTGLGFSETQTTKITPTVSESIELLYFGLSLGLSKNNLIEEVKQLLQLTEAKSFQEILELFSKKAEQNQP